MAYDLEIEGLVSYKHRLEAELETLRGLLRWGASDLGNEQRVKWKKTVNDALATSERKNEG